MAYLLLIKDNEKIYEKHVLLADSLFLEIIMFKNYLKVAFRSILRNKGFTFINVFGLAVGMACCIILFLYVQHESSFDKFHDKADQIYRVISQNEDDGGVDRFVMTPASLAPALLQDFPEVQKAVRFAAGSREVTHRGLRFYERVFFADSEVFDMFDFPLIKGDPQTALDDPYALLISERMSDKYFPSEDPVGKSLILDGDRTYNIVGVFKDIPPNSHLQFDLLGSFQLKDQTSWGVSNYLTYVLLSENADVDAFQAKMLDFIDKYRGKEVREKYRLNYLFQPLSKIHLYSHWRGELQPGTRVSSLYIFSAVGLFLLLLACFNYINMSLAKSTNRGIEVGIRKVIGANRGQLTIQFLIQSSLVTLLSLPLTILLIELILPLFNSLSGKHLAVNYGGNLSLLLFVAGIVFFTGLVSGLYPSLFLSAFQPIKILKGMFKDSFNVSLFRKSLVVLQFTISTVFIVCTFIIVGQLRFMHTKELGLDREYVVMIPIHEQEILQRYETVKDEFLKGNFVVSVSANTFYPGQTWRQNFWKEGQPEDRYPMIRWIPVDHDFIKTMGIELKEGRDFSLDFASDVNRAYILNETAVRELGWNSPLSKAFEIIERGRIIGVVKDFHFLSLHSEIEPVVLVLYPEGFNQFAVRIRSENIPEALSFLEETWNSLAVEQAFEYRFLDQEFDALYKSEMRLEKIFTWVSILSVLIACLGLFGLASYAVERRTKEIGIRKVLGASSSRLIWLLSREFTFWVLLANVFAWPVAYFIMQQWLKNFAYRAPLGLWIFLLSGFLALVIAVLTVFIQSYRAAISDPVNTLRYE